MTTLTATPQPATASIALEIVPTSTVTFLVRSDAAGIRPVRTLTGQLPTSGSTVIVDHEAALRGPVHYTLVDGGAGASAETALDIDGDWLTVPVAPAFSRRVDAPLGLTSHASERTALSTIMTVIGRPDPLVNLGPLGLRRGAFDVWCPSAADAISWESVYERGEVVQLRQQIAGLDLYHVATSTRIDPDQGRWRLSVNYVEVGWPQGDQIGTLGWTIDDVPAAYATITAVALAFETINDLTVGPTS